MVFRLRSKWLIFKIFNSYYFFEIEKGVVPELIFVGEEEFEDFAEPYKYMVKMTSGEFNGKPSYVIRAENKADILYFDDPSEPEFGDTFDVYELMAVGGSGGANYTRHPTSSASEWFR